MLFSSAIAANVIRRFKPTCRSFSKRMTAMTIMHEPHVVGNQLDCCKPEECTRQNSMQRGNSLQDKRVVVLGGSSGIGLAVAEQAASQGASVVIASSSAERVQKAVESIGREAQGQAVDVSDERAIEAFFSKLGTFDHLVFTAGDSLHLHDLAATDLQQARHAFELRYWAAPQGWGQIRKPPYSQGRLYRAHHRNRWPAPAKRMGNRGKRLRNHRSANAGSGGRVGTHTGQRGISRSRADKPLAEHGRAGA